jgi:hypothetical protein
VLPAVLAVPHLRRQPIWANQMRISANVTGDFGNVTDFGRALGCAEKIVGMEWIRAGLEPPRLMLMGA